ncbi:MAG: hypothetical protein WAN20_03420 [Pseudonocardiaceae bacterium]|jgi:hypothetical protein
MSSASSDTSSPSSTAPRSRAATRATGLDERINADAVGHAYEGLKPMDAMMRGPGMFKDKVTPPPGADLQTEFLCFLGRDAAPIP